MEPCVAGSLWSRSEPRATRHVVSQSRSANPADQRWPRWQLLPIQLHVAGDCLRGLSLSCPLFFGQLGRFVAKRASALLTDLLILLLS